MSGAWRTIRFQTDEDFNGRVIAGLRRRQPDIDLLTAAQAGLIGQGDPEVLAHAAKEGRILLTSDERSMPIHFGNFLAAGNHCPGVMILDQDVPIGTAIDAILLIWEVSEPADWVDQLHRLPL